MFQNSFPTRTPWKLNLPLKISRRIKPKFAMSTVTTTLSIQKKMKVTKSSNKLSSAHIEKWLHKIRTIKHQTHITMTIIISNRTLTLRNHNKSH